MQVFKVVSKDGIKYFIEIDELMKYINKINSFNIEKKDAKIHYHRGTSDKQILQHLKDIDHFRGIYLCDELPTDLPKNSWIISNYSKRGEEGTHWVAYGHLNDKTHPPLYFDSMGFGPDELNSILCTNSNHKKYIKEWCVKAGFKEDAYMTNRIDLQCISSDFCGEYVIKFIKDKCLPITSDGRISKKWSEYVNPTASCEQSDAIIKKHSIGRNIYFD